jgi:hypothetical protein
VTAEVATVVDPTLKEEFQALYEAIGSFDTAMRVRKECMLASADDFSREDYQAWVEEVVTGQTTPDPQMVAAWNRRLDALVRYEARQAAIEAARTSQFFSKRIRKEGLHRDKASQYMHANNAAGFILDKVLNGSSAPKHQQVINAGSLTINAPHSGLKKQKADDYLPPSRWEVLNPGDD